MTDKSLEKEFRSYKRKILKEYRTSRPSDISSGKGSSSIVSTQPKIVTGSDFGSLMNHIKKRISKGEKRNRVVKDELIKFWKKKSNKSIKSLMKKINNRYVLEKDQPQQVVHEGGGIFDDAGTIHRSEVEPTLKKIEQVLGIPGISNNVLGSTGKKNYSGDIDIALDDNVDDQQIYDKVVAAFGEENVRKSGKMVSVKVSIENYNPKRKERSPRTGFIQVDFIRGEPEWLKTYYHSPSDAESRLKGAFRNTAISAVTAHLDRVASKKTDDQGRPVKVLRWKWSNKDGLVRIKRESIPNEHTGGWVKKRKDTILGEPTKDPQKIASILFKGKAGPEALNSVESVVNAVKKSYDDVTAQKIFSRMADNFAAQSKKNKKLGNLDPNDLPEEVAKYYINELNEQKILSEMKITLEQMKKEAKQE